MLTSFSFQSLLAVLLASIATSSSPARTQQHSSAAQQADTVVLANSKSHRKAEDPVDVIRGTEIHDRLKADYEFVLRKTAELGFERDFNHVWNPDHSKIVFWKFLSSAGAATLVCWSYERVDGKMKFVKEHVYQHRFYIFPEMLENIIFHEDGFTVISKPTKEGARFTCKFKN